MGNARRIEEVEWPAAEVATELGAERGDKARTVLGQLCGRDCDGLQWIQLLYRILTGETRFGEQYRGRRT